MKTSKKQLFNKSFFTIDKQILKIYDFDKKLLPPMLNSALRYGYKK